MDSFFRRWQRSYSGLPAKAWALAAVVFVNRAGTMVVPFLSLYFVESVGLEKARVGDLIAIFGIGGMFGSLAGGWLTDRIGALSVQVISLIGTATGFIVLSALDSLWSLYLTLAFLGFIGDVFRPANIAMLAALVPREMAARAWALLRLAVNLGMTSGPVVGGYLALWSFKALFIVDAATCLVAAGLLYRFMGGRQSAPATSTCTGCPSSLAAVSALLVWSLSVLLSCSATRRVVI